MPAPPNKVQVESLVDSFAKITRGHVQLAVAGREPDVPPREALDQAIDEVVAAIAAFAAMSVSKVPTDKVKRLDDFNATFRAQLAAEIVSQFQPFQL